MATGSARVWDRVSAIPDEELWRTHERLRARLVAFARQQLRRQLIQRGAPQREIEAASEVLDPEALTIGFARRFAPYKRATLLFRNLDRLRAMIASSDRPPLSPWARTSISTASYPSSAPMRDPV